MTFLPQNVIKDLKSSETEMFMRFRKMKCNASIQTAVHCESMLQKSLFSTNLQKEKCLY